VSGGETRVGAIGNDDASGKPRQLS
jgi:hypothetical protein